MLITIELYIFSDFNASILFNSNTNEVDRQKVAETWVISGYYLGLPLLFGRSKAKDMRYIKERLWQKVQGWERRLLSQAERAVMIQSMGKLYPCM